MLLMSDVAAPAGHVAVHIVVHVAVPAAVSAAVSAAEMLPVLPMVQVLVVVEGDTRQSPAASDGCPLGMMLLTVVVAAAVREGEVQIAVQVAVPVAVQVALHVTVLTALQVAGLSGQMVVTSPSPGGSET
ncbi:hypothetical protein NDU88_005947 [Pleurodeles waltl]|uniref:Secreted protein n=1 Tax=Pleurodeles waltl TaxID=8319 RepID=A0AAV7RQS4_PLEWA|nr:hypothetical protein NDU88_005947 [Pleurodeles waltl]